MKLRAYRSVNAIQFSRNEQPALRRQKYKYTRGCQTAQAPRGTFFGAAPLRGAREGGPIGASACLPSVPFAGFVAVFREPARRGADAHAVWRFPRRVASGSLEFPAGLVSRERGSLRATSLCARGLVTAPLQRTLPPRRVGAPEGRRYRFSTAPLSSSGSRRRTPLCAIMSIFRAGDKAFAREAVLSYTLLPARRYRGRFPHPMRSCGKASILHIQCSASRFLGIGSGMLPPMDFFAVG